MKNIFSFITLLFLLLTATDSTGQDYFKKEYLDAIGARNIGPAGMSGRVTAIDVDLADTDRIFIGTASGGVWKSENGGISWEPIFDEQASLSIGAIKINQKNPSEIWVGTGEGNPRNSHNSGSGVFKTIDGGKSWMYMGLKNTRLIHRIHIHRDNPEIVFIGAMGSAWGESNDRGVYKTTNGGKNWKKSLFINSKTGVADMVADPKNPNKLIVAMWEFGRTPWDFVSGGQGSGMHISYDAGENWKKITHEDGLPEGELGRIGVAVSYSKPNIVYALVEAKTNGLYKSIDGGEKWKLVSEKNIGNRPFYYSEIYVDPQNENRIYNLWSYISKSEDGGKTFETIADYGNNVHPDHHAFWIDPNDPNYLIDGNDGGLNISRDGSKTWSFAANIPVGQFYHVDIDTDYPYNVMGGMQDNGSWVGPGFVLKEGGIRNYDWQEVLFGDGFDVAPKVGDNRYGFAMSQGGNLALYDRETGMSKFIKPTHPESKPLRYNWNAALSQDPFNECGIYYGSQYVHKSLDCGDSWEILSPDLTTNDTLKQKQDKSGGLTIDATNAENHTTILCIAPSPLDENIIWVGTDDGNLQLTTDGGQNWTNLNSRLPGFPKGAWIPQIHVSNKNKKEAFVVVNNFRQNDWSAYLYYTEDAGQSWERKVRENYFGTFVVSVIQDPVEANLLFVGTDAGLYFSLDKGNTWAQWGKKLPNVQIRDMKIHPETNDLILGTFGRAFWIIDDIGFLREMANDNVRERKMDLYLFNPSPAYLTSFRSYDGIRFIAQGEFVGDNKQRGAMITFWKKPSNIEDKKEDKKKNTDPSDDDTLKKKGKKASINILNSSGDTIQTLKRELKDGLNRVYWNLDRKAVKFPSRRSARPNANEPDGAPVLPGTYKIMLSYGKVKDYTEVEVRMDPRSNQSLQDLQEINIIVDEFNKVVEHATQGFKQLSEARKTIGLVNKVISNQPDSIQKVIKKLGKEIKQAIGELELLYMMPTDSKGIQRNPNNLNGVLQNASRYLTSSWQKPGPNSMNAFNRAKVETREVLSQINEFFDKSWKPYMDKINGLSIELFKKREPLNLD
jgi:photosystem II stability/assembly factor-like uncharacterized protein